MIALKQYAGEEFEKLKAAVMADPEAKRFFEEELGGDDERLRAHTLECAGKLEKVLNPPDPEQVFSELMKTKEGRERLYDAIQGSNKKGMRRR